MYNLQDMERLPELIQKFLDFGNYAVRWFDQNIVSELSNFLQALGNFFIAVLEFMIDIIRWLLSLLN